MNKFADNLKELILEKGISLRELEKQCGIPSSQLSRYLKSTIPTLVVAERICNYFNCSLDFLFGLSAQKSARNYKKYDLSKFIDRYEEVLSQNNITHYKFAQKYNFSEACLRHWKKGQVPKLDIVAVIAENLGTSIDYLLGRV